MFNILWELREFEWNVCGVAAGDELESAFLSAGETTLDMIVENMGQSFSILRAD